MAQALVIISAVPSRRKAAPGGIPPLDHITVPDGLSGHPERHGKPLNYHRNFSRSEVDGIFAGVDCAPTDHRLVSRIRGLSDRAAKRSASVGFKGGTNDL